MDAFSQDLSLVARRGPPSRSTESLSSVALLERFNDECDEDGVNYCARSFNQPCCGSWWAHGSLSALADREMIAAPLRIWGLPDIYW